MEQFIRTELLIGKEAVKKLNNSRVAVFGIGGVGGHCAEALVRSGVGTIDIVDNDVIAESNINRQIVALHSTIGRYKTEVMKERLLDINPDVKVNEYRCFFLPENASQFPFDKYDYVVDAVDTVTAKIAIIMAAQEHGTPVISSMGAGNKLHPEMFEIADIYKTSVCPLAKVMRQELKKRGVKKLKCVYSKEEPLQPTEESFGGELPAPDASRRSVPGSSAFTPSVAGLIIAGEVIRSLSEVSVQTVQPKTTPKVEKITAYVGEIIGIITKKSNPEIKSKKYANLTEQSFSQEKRKNASARSLMIRNLRL